ncbi:MAG TPA: MBL fold metallo-hydrolase, partial [Flavobacteriales bacterium]|nr:MBL fold metallo-hydrolase [Flavobacteriales bacterium]
MRIAKFTFNPFQENTYVLYEGSEALVIDPGCWNSSEQHELASWLADNGLTPVRLVLTHAHVDHVLGCAWMH